MVRALPAPDELPLPVFSFRVKVLLDFRRWANLHRSQHLREDRHVLVRGQQALIVWPNLRLLYAAARIVSLRAANPHSLFPLRHHPIWRDVFLTILIGYHDLVLVLLYLAILMTLINTKHTHHHCLNFPPNTLKAAELFRVRSQTFSTHASGASLKHG